MEISETLKKLRSETNLSQKEFSAFLGIPLRTIEDWESGKRKPPEYIPRLIAYRIKFEMLPSITSDHRNVNIIRDADGNQIVLINDIIFKGKRGIHWDDVKNYLKQYVGEFYAIADTKDVIYIGNDLPDEFSGSNYTMSLKGMAAKAKANAAQGIPEMIEIASGKYDIIDIKKETSNSIS